MSHPVDDLDVGVLLYVLENPGATATKVTRALFEMRTKTDYHRVEVLVRYRMKRLLQWGLVTRAMDGNRGLYHVVPEKVHVGIGHIQLQVRGFDKVLSTDAGEFLVVTNGTDDLGDATIRSIDAIVNAYQPDEEGS